MWPQAMEEDRSAAGAQRPKGFSAGGVFLFFGATMVALAGTMLIWRGTFLDPIWALNTSAYKQLAPFGKTAGILFLGLSLALATAGIGWFLRRFWAWWLAVGIITTQAAGDMVNALLGQFVRGAVGAAIAGALLFYLLQPRVRAAFAARPKK